MDDATKERIAKQCAKMFLTQMAAVPTDVQLMMIDFLVRTIFVTGIKEERRLELFDEWIQPIRKEIESGPPKEKVATNGS